MRAEKKCESPSSSATDPNASLREVAAYLRGVADATAALSDAPAPQLRLVPSGGSETVGSIAPRRTLPYDGPRPSPRRDTLHSGPVAEYPSLEALEDESLDSPDDVFDAPFTDERPSRTRLRVGALAPEWFELLGRRAG